MMLVGPSVGTPTLTTRVPDLQNVSLRGWFVRRVRDAQGPASRSRSCAHWCLSRAMSQAKVRCRISKTIPSQCDVVSPAPHRHEAAAPARDPSPRSRMLGQRLRCRPSARQSSRSPGRSRARCSNTHVVAMRLRTATVGGDRRWGPARSTSPSVAPISPASAEMRGRKNSQGLGVLQRPPLGLELSTARPKRAGSQPPQHSAPWAVPSRAQASVGVSPALTVALSTPHADGGFVLKTGVASVRSRSVGRV
jgi:hypothetical protein